jgi:hypothetical protein
LIFYGPQARDRELLPHDPFKAIVAPRPIGWVREQMNLTSAKLPQGESEFEHAGLEAAPSRLVAPPRVAASPCALEPGCARGGARGRRWDTS